MAHKWAKELNGKTDSLNDFYNHYLNEANTEFKDNNNNKSVISDISFSNLENNVLFVIDMQNDFVKKDGNFSVADGVEMAPKLLDFIVSNDTNFSKIIMSRDTHDTNHCSFINDGLGGIFPRHCVINTPGAEFYEGYASLNKTLGEKVKVIFKGMPPNADSFGAVTYTDSNYYNKRYSGKKCCNQTTTTTTPDTTTTPNEEEPKCMDLTGGFYLNDPTKSFIEKPFCENCKTYEEIKGEFGKNFELNDILENTSITTNVFIVGLAGDFCCKDTAINIATQAKNQSKKVNVFIIEEFVRCAFLPCNAVPIEIKENEKPTFNNYLFSPNGNGFKILSEDEAKEALELDEESFKSKNYSHFLTDPADIIKDYAEHGVQILMKSPTFTSPSFRFTGGKKTHKNKKLSKKLKVKRFKKSHKNKIRKNKSHKI